MPHHEVEEKPVKPIELPLSLRVASSPPEHHAIVKRKEKEPEKPFPWDIIAGELTPGTPVPRTPAAIPVPLSLTLRA